MAAPLLAVLDPQRVMGYVFLACAVGVCLWIGVELLTGTAQMGEYGEAGSYKVRREKEPGRFKRIMILNAFGALVCFLASGFLLL